MFNEGKFHFTRGMSYLCQPYLASRSVSKLPLLVWQLNDFSYYGALQHSDHPWQFSIYQDPSGLAACDKFSLPVPRKAAGTITVRIMLEQLFGGRHVSQSLVCVMCLTSVANSRPWLVLAVAWESWGHFRRPEEAALFRHTKVMMYLLKSTVDSPV